MQIHMKIGPNLIPLEKAEMAREVGGAIAFIIIILFVGATLLWWLP
jgi:hypothetical protein